MFADYSNTELKNYLDNQWHTFLVDTAEIINKNWDNKAGFSLMSHYDIEDKVRKIYHSLFGG